MLLKMFSRPVLRLSVAILFNDNLLRTSSVFSKDLKQRNYARWSARKPSKVFTSDEVLTNEVDGAEAELYESDYEGVNDSVKPERKNKEEFRIYKDKSGYEHEYKVLSADNLTFSKLMTIVGNRKMRRKNDLIMLEGKRLNMDALQTGMMPKKLFFTQHTMLDDLNLPADHDIPLLKLPYNTVKLWSKMDTPPGIFGFYSIPREGSITAVDPLPVRVLCDNVRDPGNMGAIIRVAASVGCTQVILMKGCTDPWDSKVLRSASGGHFHIPISTDLTWQEHQDFLQPTDTLYLADSRTARSSLPSSGVPCLSYDHVDYAASQSAVVVIGGETEGLSNEALKIASKYNGTRVYIPMSNCMDSLNTGCALSVVLFEAKRQMSKSGRLREMRSQVDEDQKCKDSRHESSASG